MMDLALRTAQKLHETRVVVRVQDSAHLGQRIQRPFGMGPEGVIRLLERQDYRVLVCPRNQDIVRRHTDLVGID
jgi:hypothetical protein